MTTPPGPDDRADPERDAWLREALRHAPDAQAAPPASVSDAILREARAAARGPAAATPAVALGRWAQAWAWLARPPVAAGFASVMVALLVGLIWWDEPIDPGARPAPTARDASAPREEPPSSPAATESRNAARAPAPPPRAAAAPKPPPTPTAPRAEESAAPEALPSAPLPPAPAPQTDSSASARDDAGAPPAALSRRASAVDAQEQRATSAKTAADTAQELVSRPAAWTTIQASIVGEPARWHWQRNGLAQPMTPALQRWLAQFDAATRDRWRRTAEAAPAPAGRVLRLYRDGAPVAAATLRFDAERVWFTPDTHAAALPAATLDRLLKDLDTATP